MSERPPEPRAERSQATTEWFVVVAADGTVHQVEGGAPATWVGHRLSEAPGAPEALRDAVRRLVEDPRDGGPVRRVRLTARQAETSADLEVVLVEAVLLRRAYTQVPALIVRLLDLFALQAKSSAIDLTVEHDKETPSSVEIDGEKIAWALSALISNALRFARHHVRVRLGWDAEWDEVLVSVADDGPGMTAGQARWLFERDPTTGRAAGVALLVVRDVVEAHRGRITVDAEEGRGTTVTLHLPRGLPAGDRRR